MNILFYPFSISLIGIVAMIVLKSLEINSGNRSRLLVIAESISQTIFPEVSFFERFKKYSADFLKIIRETFSEVKKEILILGAEIYSFVHNKILKIIEDKRMENQAKHKGAVSFFLKDITAHKNKSHRD
jgi:hypothetical protein